MMAGLILLVFCVAVYVIVSLLTPRPAQDHLTDLCWGNPSRAIMRGKITEPTDPRVMAGILVVVMIILYIIFH